MINAAVVRRGVALLVPKGFLLKNQALFGSLSHLQQKKAHAAAGCVAHQPQDLGYQIKFRPQGAQFPQPLRLVDQKEVPAEP